MDKVGIVLVGAGYWGPNLARNINACSETELLYLCELDLERGRRITSLYPKVKLTSDFDSVLADPDVAAVVIATPVATHYPLARKALLAKKHVLLEKPMTSSVEEAEELVALAAEQGCQLMCDHTFCYTGTVRKMKEYAESGELGRILYYDSMRVNLGLFQSDVNVIWDLCPHDFSIVDFIFPDDVRPVGVSASALDPVHNGQASIANVTLHFEQPVVAHFNVNWLSPVKVRTTLLGGDKKMVVWDDNNPAERLKVYDRGIDVSGEERDEALVQYRRGDVRIPVLDNTEALEDMIYAFATAIQTGQPSITDGRAGLRIVRLLEATDRSIAQGGARVDVTLD